MAALCHRRHCPSARPRAQPPYVRPRSSPSLSGPLSGRCVWRYRHPPAGLVTWCPLPPRVVRPLWHAPRASRRRQGQQPGQAAAPLLGARGAHPPTPRRMREVPLSLEARPPAARRARACTHSRRVRSIRARRGRTRPSPTPRHLAPPPRTLPSRSHSTLTRWRLCSKTSRLRCATRLRRLGQRLSRSRRCSPLEWRRRGRARPARAGARTAPPHPRPHRARWPTRRPARARACRLGCQAMRRQWRSPRRLHRAPRRARCWMRRRQ